jgi:hypothetical protein
MAKGQQINDTIETVHSLGTGFRFQGETLSPKRLLEVMQLKLEAHAEMKIAKMNYNACRNPNEINLFQ